MIRRRESAGRISWLGTVTRLLRQAHAEGSLGGRTSARPSSRHGTELPVRSSGVAALLGGHHSRPAIYLVDASGWPFRACFLAGARPPRASSPATLAMGALVRASCTLQASRDPMRW